MATPRLIETYCVGGYKNLCMTVWKSSVKVSSIIMWENVVLPVLLLYKHQMIIGNKIQGSNVVFKFMDIFFPLFIHECISHECVAKDQPK